MENQLADRLIEYCELLNPNEMKQQILDSMDIEREQNIN